MSNIIYAPKSWNPLSGCSPVSEGCEQCWASTLHNRRHAANLKQAMIFIGLVDAGERHIRFTEGWPQYVQRVGAPEEGWAVRGRKLGVRLPCPPQYDLPYAHVQTFVERLDQPLHWRKPRTVAVGFMSDIALWPDEFIDKVFAVMALTPQHTYLLLTKRPERMRAYMTGGAGFRKNEAVMQFWTKRPRIWNVPGGPSGVWPLPNVWLGVSAENQARADERIPLLLDTPAAHRWVSVEPLLEALDLRRWMKPQQLTQNGLGLGTLDDKPGQNGLEERDHVSNTIHFPSAHRLPSVAANPSIIPPDSPADIGVQPIHDGGSRTVDGHFSSGSSAQLMPSSLSPPLEIALSVEEASEVAEPCPIRSDMHGLFEESLSSPPYGNGLTVETSPDSSSPDVEAGGDVHNAASGLVGPSNGSLSSLFNPSHNGTLLHPHCTTIDWVIVGGESGIHARPCDLGWIRDIRDQCKVASVPCYVKQMGSAWAKEMRKANPGQAVLWDSKGENWDWWMPSLRVREMPEGSE